MVKDKSFIHILTIEILCNIIHIKSSAVNTNIIILLVILIIILIHICIKHAHIVLRI